MNRIEQQVRREFGEIHFQIGRVPVRKDDLLPGVVCLRCGKQIGQNKTELRYQKKELCKACKHEEHNL